MDKLLEAKFEKIDYTASTVLKAGIERGAKFYHSLAIMELEIKVIWDKNLYLSGSLSHSMATSAM